MIDQLKIDFEKILKKSNFSKNNINFKREQLNKFIENGFPNRKLENWKFLDIDQIIKKDIGELSFYNDYSVTNKIDTSILVNGLEHNKIIFINGRIEKIDFDYEDKNKIEINDEIEKNDLVFTLDGKVISLAGVMGGASTACGKNTYKVLIECAYFKPEEILGQARKYNLNSEAAYKFERGVDFLGQENVLRRFIKIIDDHAEIKSLKFISENKKNNTKSVPYDSKKLNEIIGCDINEKEQKAILSSLGFINGKKVAVPAHRSDIDQINDLAEEITRVVGYNNIPSKALKLPVKAKNLNRFL